MLLELNVKDIALIKKARVEFGEGLNILTGETGAGKSIVIGSIGLALGAKARGDLLREGAEEAYIELVFQTEPGSGLQEKLRSLGVALEEDGLLIISRRIGTKRSVSKINDETVTLARLREVTSLLIDIYGQHEYQTLLDPKQHLEILDALCRRENEALFSALQEAYRSYSAAKKRLQDFSMDEESRKREMDFAAFEIGEIEAAGLREGEEQELAARYRRMSHARQIAEHLSRAYGLLSENSVSEALSEVTEAAGYDEGLSALRDQLCDAESILSEAAREVRDYGDSLEMDEAAFQETEQRLDLIRGLMAKYGGSEAAVEAYRKKKADRLLELQDYEETRKRYAAEAGEAEAALLKLCRSLSEKRRIAAEKLSEAVCRELRDLGFESVSFRAEFGEREPSPEGTDTVCFMTSLNPGEKERPLQEVASGGELSRIMLALKTVLAETDDIPTLIFDEIDTGISGRTAQKVAEKLDIISGGHQVICITHLPQIAAMADRHFVIQKETREGRNETEIRPLSGENSLSELTRLLGGARITEAVLQNAREMKELAQKEKKMHKEARKKKDEL